MGRDLCMELVHGTCAGDKALCKPIEDHEIVQVDEAFGGGHACVMGPRLFRWTRTV